MAEDRQRYPIRLTDKARRGYGRLEAAEGCTFTALLEAIGLELDDRQQVIPARVVKRARLIDQERRSRR